MGVHSNVFHCAKKCDSKSVVWPPRYGEQRSSGSGGAWLQDAVSSRMPCISPWVDAELLEEGTWGETHLWVPAGLPGGLLHLDRASVPAWGQPVIKTVWICKNGPVHGPVWEQRNTD